MYVKSLAASAGGLLAHVMAGACPVKVKNEFDLKNFDLNNFDPMLGAQEASPDPIPSPWESPPSANSVPAPVNPEGWNLAPAPVNPEPWSPAPAPVDPEGWNLAPPPANPEPWNSAPAPLVIEPDFGQAPSGVQNELNHLALAYNPFTAPAWKAPRWLIATIGVFFGSAAIVMVTLCVVLLRDPKAPPPTVQLVVPTAPAVPTVTTTVATTSATPAPPSEVSRAAPAIQKTPMNDGAALGYRVAVSRHPAPVRRQTYGSRRITHKSERSPAADEEPETRSSRPPQDALDKLLAESAL
jgi:hypothetical protein